MISIFTAAAEIYKSYRIFKGVSRLFLKNTASIIEKVGNADFNAAKQCLEDSQFSLNPENELRMAIVHLQASEKKFSNNNKGKVQANILISVCYMILGDKNLAKKYIKHAKDNFDVWLKENRPSALSNVLPMPVGFINYSKYSDFKESVTSFGIPWKGCENIPSFATFNGTFMHLEIEQGCLNAKQFFYEKLDHLFDLPKETLYKCDCCNSIREFSEITLSNSNNAKVTMALLCNSLDYKVLECLECKSVIIVDNENNIVKTIDNGKH